MALFKRGNYTYQAERRAEFLYIDEQMAEAQPAPPQMPFLFPPPGLLSFSPMMPSVPGLSSADFSVCFVAP